MAKDPSRTEAATPKQIDKAREKGNVPKSQELTKVINVLAGYVALSIAFGFIGRHIMAIFRHFLSNAPTFVVTDTNLHKTALWLSQELAKMVLPILLTIGVATFMILRWQVGKLWTTKVFEFKLSKFNPIAGLKRIFFSARTIFRLLKSLLQALCIGIAPILVIKNEFHNFITLYYMEASEVALYILHIASKMVTYALVPMVIIAVADLLYTKWEYAENLKMTKSEVKDERKQAEGDPVIKSKLRQKMMQMSMRRMMQDVPKADVVITNPTHIAIALRYDPTEAPAPVVVAMGANKVAEKIKELAKQHNVPLRENKPLARALYKQVEVGDTIPPEMFQAVAIILAQIWKNKPPKRGVPFS